MTFTVDTNVLVRLVLQDDPAQAQASERLMARAEKVVIPLSTLCEYVWVLRSVYKLSDAEIASDIEAFGETENIFLDYSAVQAGLLTLQAGGDFADGAIAHEGRRLGGEVFASFDRKAVRLVRAQGHRAELL